MLAGDQAFIPLHFTPCFQRTEIRKVKDGVKKRQDQDCPSDYFVKVNMTIAGQKLADWRISHARNCPAQDEGQQYCAVQIQALAY